MSRLSVVVPVYNVEKYLDVSLGSLEDQSLADIDIICVNDGSTDGSRAVLARWEKRDPRIRVVDKPNGGLSSARNAGIDAATTEYVCFLDSDDRFHPNACAEMVRLLDQTGADVLTFGATLCPPDARAPWILPRALAPRRRLRGLQLPAHVPRELTPLCMAHGREEGVSRPGQPAL